MKKLLLTMVFSLLYVSSASAEFGVNVGGSGQLGLFTASGEEKSGTIKKDSGTEHGVAGYGSLFIEGVLGDRFIVGVDYVPQALATDSVETAKSDMGPDASTQTTVENKVQVDFENLTTLYGAIMVNESLYVKLGVVTVDVITNESLATGANYANTDLDGSMYGIGYHTTLDNGVFLRVEGSYMDLGGASLNATGTATDSQISLSSLDGVSGKVSIGKSF